MPADCGTPAPMGSADIEAYQDDGNFSNGVYTVPSKGIYEVIASRMSTYKIQSYIFKNSVQLSGYSWQGYSEKHTFNAGDQLEFTFFNTYCAQDTTALQADTFFILRKIVDLP